MDNTHGNYQYLKFILPFQSIIEIVIRRLGANISLSSKYYGVKLQNTETKTFHWLNPSLTMIEVKSKYRNENTDDVWRYVLLQLTIDFKIMSMVKQPLHSL